VKVKVEVVNLKARVQARSDTTRRRPSPSVYAQLRLVDVSRRAVSERAFNHDNVFLRTALFADFSNTLQQEYYQILYTGSTSRFSESLVEYGH